MHVFTKLNSYFPLQLYFRYLGKTEYFVIIGNIS